MRSVSVGQFSLTMCPFGSEQNNPHPLYIQSFTEADDALKLHLIVHCSLDVIDERGSYLCHLTDSKFVDFFRLLSAFLHELVISSVLFFFPFTPKSQVQH
uniref:Trafficking protein particle complex subunit 2-like protein n=1 Tax=Noccaea caerulescens TaxID=107243 RepID=A0A1J3GA68_NOCCA